MNDGKLENKEWPLYLARFSAWAMVVLLVYVPFHILLSTWFGTFFGVLTGAKVALNIVLAALVIISLPEIIRTGLLARLFKNTLWQLALGFVALNLILLIARPTDWDAAVLGLTYNLRFLVAGGLVWCLAQLFPTILEPKKLVKYVLFASIPVIVFGILQYFVFPSDFLESFGYSRANGVLPAFFIDDKPDLPRIMSFLRDPNTLGSYLIIILSLAGAFLLAKGRHILSKPVLGWVIAGAGICLVLTFSRSAWLGAVVAGLVLGLRSPRGWELARTYKMTLLASLLALLCIVTVGGIIYKDSYFAKNIVFHADEQTVMEDPNELRGRFWRESVESIKAEPLGSGPGKAGLASIKNDVDGVVLNENYYLQTAQETGILGIVMFASILVLAGVALWKAGVGDPVAVALFSAFTGLLVTNLLVHIWANEAVALTFWILFGAWYGLRSHEIEEKEV